MTWQGGALAKSSEVQVKDDALRVSVGRSGKPVFSDESGVQGLETFLAAVLGQLVYTSGSFELKPGLLSRYYWDFEQKWYVLELREGLKFHNGRAVTAGDLEFSLLRGLISKKGSWFKSFFANVEGIRELDGKSVYKPGMASGLRVLDSRRLAVKLSSPNPSFLHSLSRSYFSVVPREEMNDDYLTWKRFPVGAGPYRVVSTTSKGSQVMLEKYDVGASGPKRISFTSNGDEIESDIILGAPSEGSSFATETSARANGLTGIYFNFSNEFGKNLSFRRAVGFAVARAPLVDGVAAYNPSNELLVSHFWGRAGVKESHDLERAKAEFSKLKVPSTPIKIPVFNSEIGNGARSKYLETLRRQLAAAGLNVVFEKSQKKFFDESDQGIPFRIMTLGADVPDPTVLLGLFRNGSPITPHYPPSDAEYERLYQNVAKAQSQDQRVLSVKAISQYFVDHAFAVPLFEAHASIGVNRKKVKSLGGQDGGLALYLERVVVNQ
ncbi:MAG: ABC transporter substrate-binding protein [Bdellovibrionales bacterium]